MSAHEGFHAFVSPKEVSHAVKNAGWEQSPHENSEIAEPGNEHDLLILQDCIQYSIYHIVFLHDWEENREPRFYPLEHPSVDVIGTNASCPHSAFQSSKFHP